jgi:DedD protein
MTDGTAPEREERGLSARQLVLMFLAGVAVCAVFFAAGFLVGYNERGSREAPLTERVTPSGVIPPTVNPPLKTEAPGAESPATPTPAKPAAVSEENLGAGAPPAGKSQPAPASPAAGAPVEPPGKFAIQVAASSTREDAEKVVKTLQAKGYPAFLVPPDKADPNDKLYRVQVGPYATRDEAEQMKPRLEKEGFTQSFIKH